MWEISVEGPPEFGKDAPWRIAPGLMKVWNERDSR